MTYEYLKSKLGKAVTVQGRVKKVRTLSSNLTFCLIGYGNSFIQLVFESSPDISRGDIISARAFVLRMKQYVEDCRE